MSPFLWGFVCLFLGAFSLPCLPPFSSKMKESLKSRFNRTGSGPFFFVFFSSLFFSPHLFFFFSVPLSLSFSFHLPYCSPSQSSPKSSKSKMERRGVPPQADPFLPATLLLQKLPPHLTLFDPPLLVALELAPPVLRLFLHPVPLMRQPGREEKEIVFFFFFFNSLCPPPFLSFLPAAVEDNLRYDFFPFSFVFLCFPFSYSLFKKIRNELLKKKMMTTKRLLALEVFFYYYFFATIFSPYFSSLLYFFPFLNSLVIEISKGRYYAF